MASLPKGNGNIGSARGRGETAVADMKARLAALRNSGKDDKQIFSELWDRNQAAVMGNGHTYEYASSNHG